MVAVTRQLNERLDAQLAASPFMAQARCERGCNACCRLFVSVSYPEAATIVTQFPDAVKRAHQALEAERDAVRALQKSLGISDMLDGKSHRDMAGAWWALQRPCSFLVDGECSIYAARPLTCRNYHVRTDPALCSAVPFDDSIEAIGADDVPAVSAELARAMKHSGDTAYVIGDLASMVLHAQARIRAE